MCVEFFLRWIRPEGITDNRQRPQNARIIGKTGIPNEQYDRYQVRMQSGRVKWLDTFVDQGERVRGIMASAFVYPDP